MYQRVKALDNSIKRNEVIGGTKKSDEKLERTSQTNTRLSLELAFFGSARRESTIAKPRATTTAPREQRLVNVKTVDISCALRSRNCNFLGNYSEQYKLYRVSQVHGKQEMHNITTMNMYRARPPLVLFFLFFFSLFPWEARGITSVETGIKTTDRAFNIGKSRRTGYDAAISSEILLIRKWTASATRWLSGSACRGYCPVGSSVDAKRREERAWRICSGVKSGRDGATKRTISPSTAEERLPQS
jgi:hypothetical protein